MLARHGSARIGESSVAALSVDRAAVYQASAIGSISYRHHLERNQLVFQTGRVGRVNLAASKQVASDDPDCMSTSIRSTTDLMQAFPSGIGPDVIFSRMICPKRINDGDNGSAKGRHFRKLLLRKFLSAGSGL
jgi:hypothetical protein